MKVMKAMRQMILLTVCMVAVGLPQIDPEIDARLEKRSHTFQETTLPYRLYVPDNYSSDLSYPLLLFLHGARWAGTDNVTQLDNELALYWIDSTRQVSDPCFVVYPQIPRGSTWEYTAGNVDELPESAELATANDIITSLLAEFSIDASRLYLCGKSIGGLGVYGMVARYPDRYAALIPAAGSYLYRDFATLSKHAMWIFHNRDDDVVSAEQSRHIVSALQDMSAAVVLTHCDFSTGACNVLSNSEISSAIQSGARYFYSEFDDAGHQLEPNVVSTFGLYEWTMTQKRSLSKVESKISNPRFIGLLNNYPNPFNATTKIEFTISNASHVNLTIYGVQGQRVATLLNSWLEKGRHVYTWQAEDVPSGVYVAKLTTDVTSHTKRCLLLK